MLDDYDQAALKGFCGVDNMGEVPIFWALSRTTKNSKTIATAPIFHHHGEPHELQKQHQLRPLAEEAGAEKDSELRKGRSRGMVPKRVKRRSVSSTCTQN
jgi:hypothetical protein